MPRIDCLFLTLLVLGVTTGCHTWSGASCHSGIPAESVNWRTRDCCTKSPCDPVAVWTHGKYIPLLDNHLTKKAACHCAETAYHQYVKDLCGGSPSCDFHHGWRQAYIDLAFGADGATPAVPPERYWKANNRTCPGHERVKDWFAGYEAGVCNARHQGRSDYITIQSSVCRPATNWVGSPGTGVSQAGCPTCR